MRTAIFIGAILIAKAIHPEPMLDGGAILFSIVAGLFSFLDCYELFFKKKDK